MTDDFKSFFKDIDPGIEFEDTNPAGQAEQEIEVVQPLKGEELDSLVGEVGIERQDGEKDRDLRERAAKKALETDAIKALEMVLGKRQSDWHPDEGMLVDTVKKAEHAVTEKFITDYLDREEVSEENKQIAAQHSVTYPQFCVMTNEMREVMTWFLGTVAPWERDPCFGCSFCMMGKHPETPEAE